MTSLLSHRRFVTAFVTRALYRFACWLDLKMHDVLDRHLTFSLRGKAAAFVHIQAHNLAYLCRPCDV